MAVRNMVSEEWDIGRLIPAEDNVKNHTTKQIGHIVASIRAYGFNDPIGVTPEGVIVEGHGRHMAATAMGMTTVPVIVLHGFSDRDRQLYAIAHNRLCMETSFDYTEVRKELTRVFVGSQGTIDFGAFGISDRHYDAASVVVDGAALVADEAASNVGGAGYSPRQSAGQQKPLTTYEYLFSDQTDLRKVRSFLSSLQTDANKDLTTSARFLDHIQNHADDVILAGRGE